MPSGAWRRRGHDTALVGQLRFARLARGLPEAVVARPTGVGRAISTYTIPIEGRDEWLAAARRLA